DKSVKRTEYSTIPAYQRKQRPISDRMITLDNLSYTAVRDKIRFHLLLHRALFFDAYSECMANSLSHKSDEELYGTLCRRDASAHAAFEELYTRHSPRVYTYCRRMLNST